MPVPAVQIEGPRPRSGSIGLCAYCCMTYKSSVLALNGRRLEAEVQAAVAAGESRVFRLQHYHEPHEIPLPCEAVTVTLITGNETLGPLPVCWSHLLAPQVVEAKDMPKPSGLAVAQGPLPETVPGPGGLVLPRGRTV
jgi:hypothetical protein